jgi:hypothetical protein
MERTRKNEIAVRKTTVILTLLVSSSVTKSPSLVQFTETIKQSQPTFVLWYETETESPTT